MPLELRQLDINHIGQFRLRVIRDADADVLAFALRSEEHTSELQSPCISYAVFCLKKKIRVYPNKMHKQIDLNRLLDIAGACDLLSYDHQLDLQMAASTKLESRDTGIYRPTRPDRNG